MEQARGRGGNADPRVGVSALGALLFELVTGRRPRELGGLPVTTALREVAEGELPRVRAIDPTLPRDLETIIGKALEQRPERRYDSAAAFAADLRRFLGHHPVLARRPSVLDRGLKYVRRHRVFVGGAGATVLALTVGLGIASDAARDASRGREASRAQLYAAEMVLGTISLEPDGNGLVVPAPARVMCVVDRSSGDIRAAWDGPILSVNAFHWNPDGARIAAGGYDFALWIFGVGPRSIHLERIVDECHEPLLHLAWSRTGDRIAVAVEDSTVRIYDPHDGRRLEVFQAHRTQVRRVAWSPDGAQIVSVATHGEALVWPVGARPATQRVALPPRPSNASRGKLSWSRDGGLLACSGDAGQGVVLTRSGQVVRETPGSYALTLAPAGRFFALIVGGNHVELHDLDAARTHAATRVGGASCVAWSPDGAALVIGCSDGTLRLLSRATGELLERLDGHAGRVEAVGWRPSGDRIASAARARTVKVWDPSTGALVASFDCGSRLCAVRGSPDGTQLVALDVEGVVHFWDAGDATSDLPDQSSAAKSHEGARPR